MSSIFSKIADVINKFTDSDHDETETDKASVETETEEAFSYPAFDKSEEQIETGNAGAEKTETQKASAPEQKPEPATQPETDPEPQQGLNSEPKHRKEPETGHESAPKSKPINPTNGIANQENLTDAISRTLDKVFRGASESVEKKALRIHIADYSLFILCNNETYLDSLAVRLQNETGLVFKRITIEQHVVDIENSIRIADGISLTFEGADLDVVRNDSFTLTLKQGSFTGGNKVLKLTADRDKTSFNIGVSANSMIPGKGFRINDIAIDDNPESDSFRYNRFVSHCHARIDAVGSNGTFALSVENGGTRLAGKRTRIFRGPDIIEVDNPLAPVRLYDNDIIELSKNVLMRFTLG